ncbi:hypothetical protein CC86DRAFT_144022 [Ophiobolus disseminans]|uniref:Uncharacterized protein n=1 Tax=Ophiobolus disseminans TaxID=1469910 RepID=A0A6A6ZG73_9PLEO|nr:hypothetical protein CC86DRAFT_144022 [Ophiobolus disseminans]
MYRGLLIEISLFLSVFLHLVVGMYEIDRIGSDMLFTSSMRPRFYMKRQPQMLNKGKLCPWGSCLLRCLAQLPFSSVLQ